jgi:hypothetical protein
MFLKMWFILLVRRIALYLAKGAPVDVRQTPYRMRIRISIRTFTLRTGNTSLATKANLNDLSHDLCRRQLFQVMHVDEASDLTANEQSTLRIIVSIAECNRRKIVVEAAYLELMVTDAGACIISLCDNTSSSQTERDDGNLVSICANGNFSGD